MIAKDRSFNEIDGGELLFSSTFGMGVGWAQTLVPKVQPTYVYRSDPSAMHTNNLMSQINGYYTFTYPFFYGILPTIGSSTIFSAAGEGYDRRTQFIKPSEKVPQLKPTQDTKR